MSGRDPDEVRMCNCASCGMELLGSVEREWALSLSPTERARFPQLVAGRIRERPYCMGCFRDNMLLAARVLCAEHGLPCQQWQVNILECQDIAFFSTSDCLQAVEF